MLSQRQAAQAWGVSRATIQRAIKAGKLSVLADKSIDPSEMVRAFGEPVSHPQNRLTVPDEPTMSRGVSHPETALLRAENEHLRAMVAEKDARIDDLRNAMRLLEGPKGTAPRRSLWARLFR
jgi:DNA-binding transcriptional MocR family regulator